MDKYLLHKIALSLIPNIGPVLARKLVAYLGSVEAVFTENKNHLLKVPGIGNGILARFNREEVLQMAEKELEFLQKNQINCSFYLDEDYPKRLKECDDSPIILYFKGENCFDAQRIISLVGTRRATHYGEQACRQLIQELAELFPEIIIISGFAYGIDICAHKEALNAGLRTIAVFGHGIEQVYPAAHKKYLNQIIANGTIVSEFPSQQKPDPGNFVSRNRIIAGLSDATIVVESGEKGGSLLTADMALSYHRDVFAFPGRAGDTLSKGCNNLIKKNMAALIESASDLIYFMKWDTEMKPQAVQKSLFLLHTPEEEELIKVLSGQESLSLDQLARNLAKPVSQVSSMLLSLEFSGQIISLPGKHFKLA